MYRHGHYGVALALAAPATLVAGPTVGLLVSLIAVVTSMLPDWDIRVPRINHRGPTHTLLFAVAAATILGLVATVGWLGVQAVAPLVLSAAAFSATSAPATAVGALVATGTFLGVTSHLLADALNPGYGSNAMRPFWPTSDRTLKLASVPVDSPVWNWGLFVAGATAQVLSLSLAGGFG